MQLVYHYLNLFISPAKIINTLSFVLLPLIMLMEKIRNNIPNFITLLNLISGSAAVILALSGETALSGWLIFLAAVFDFMDGFAARLLKARSEIGAQLDSLADVISFGLAPSVIVYQLILQCPGVPIFSAGNFQAIPFIGLLLVAGSAYRLAKFNTDPGQETVFKGLPTPAMGLFVAALPLIRVHPGLAGNFDSLMQNFYFLLAITIFLSWIMISNIPMISLKLKSIGWKGNEARYILAGSLPILFVFFRFTAIPMIIFLYIIISIITLPKKTIKP
jgi:CDP-diacylglycerol--serine O-phosphatidyltransferase